MVTNYFLINCTSETNLISTPIRILPTSSAAFHVSPNVFRLIFPDRDTPALVLPQGYLDNPPYAASRVIGLITSLMVRFPIISNSPSLIFYTGRRKMAANSLNFSETFVNILCFTLNPISECEGSITQID